MLLFSPAVGTTLSSYCALPKTRSKPSVPLQVVEQVCKDAGLVFKNDRVLEKSVQFPVPGTCHLSVMLVPAVGTEIISRRLCQA